MKKKQMVIKLYIEVSLTTNRRNIWKVESESFTQRRNGSSKCNNVK